MRAYATRAAAENYTSSRHAQAHRATMMAAFDAPLREGQTMMIAFMTRRAYNNMRAIFHRHARLRRRAKIPRFSSRQALR